MAPWLSSFPPIFCFKLFSLKFICKSVPSFSSLFTVCPSVREHFFLFCCISYRLVVFDLTCDNRKQVPRGYIKCDYSIVTYCTIVYDVNRDVFRCVLASLYEDVSVRMSVRPSVTFKEKPPGRIFLPAWAC